MAVMGVWGLFFKTGPIKADFPRTENKEVHHLCPIHEVLTGIWNPLISGQIVNSFGELKWQYI